jgi:pimeloyl-ACP methyl ester carboxylesterase
MTTQGSGTTPVKISRREVSVAGHPTIYHVAGSGEPVILIHGLSGSGRWWRRNLPALSERYHTYLVDLPRFGAMHRTGRFILAEAATWLLAWMDAAGLRRADVIGHSMGGLIAIRLAAKRPAVVSRLVLVAPAGVSSKPSLAAQALPLLRAARHSRPSFFPMLAYDALRAGPRTLWRAARDLVSDNVRDDLGAIRSPTLVIVGRHDPLTPPDMGAVLQKAIADARLLVIEGAGHVVMYDQPDIFNDAVLAFLAGAPESATAAPSPSAHVCG